MATNQPKTEDEIELLSQDTPFAKMFKQASEELKESGKGKEYAYGRIELMDVVPILRCEIYIAKRVYDTATATAIKDKKYHACQTCGIADELPREPIFLDNNILSIASYLEDKCPECGHMRTGWNLKCLKEYHNKIYQSATEQSRHDTLEEIKKWIADRDVNRISTDLIMQKLSELENKKV
jgi:hypothetical protein